MTSWEARRGGVTDVWEGEYPDKRKGDDFTRPPRVYVIWRETAHRLREKLIVVALISLLVGGGCAALTEGRIVTREGRETPFKPMSEQYSLPKDPVTQR